MARCKRTSQVRTSAIAAGGYVAITLGVNTVEYTLRVVDAAAFGAIAFTFANDSDPGALFHFQPGESYQEAGIGPLASALVIRVGAAVAARAELIVWEQ